MDLDENMSSRGQKRAETVDELPADKRACTSSSSPPTPIIPVQEVRDADMETSSSTSGSTRSEGDGENVSTYGSCDSDNNLREYYRHRSGSDQSKFKKVLASLTEEVDESGQLAILTELCELLSFCSDNSFSSQLADSFSPILVRLARHERNPDIMLLSVRAITYLCDVNPRSAGFLVRHDAVPALCQRLMAIEYLDVAEQCLLALEKISREQPLSCLQSGAIMAVLGYIDFFSTSVQRLALSTVVNICKKLSSESPSLFMDAVPILCNLLQYEDKQLVESVATCLIRMVEQVYHSSDMLDEICKHGLIQHALHLIGLNSRTTLSQPTYIGLIGLLVKLASGSTAATKTLLELDLSNTVKEMLSTYDLSHETQSIPMVEGYHGQMYEVLKLLNEVLPTITVDQGDQLKTDKATFLLDHPDILQKFGFDLLPILIQVVNSGVNLFIFYGCLTVVNKLVHFSTCDALPSLLSTANFSSFLAGVFTRKDHHLILLALQIVETIMLKLPHVYLHSFIKEGVLFAICALLSPDKDLKLSPGADGMQLESDGTKKSVVLDTHKCPCCAFGACQSSKSLEKESCKLQKNAVQNLAKHIWTTYFAAEATNPEKGVTDTLQNLQTLACALTGLVNECLTDASSSHQEENIYDLLQLIVSKLNEKDSISTFELVESGITKALVNYLSSGRDLVREEENIDAGHLYVMEKRLMVFGQLLLSCADTSLEEFPFLTLTRRLQSALSSVEIFPVVSSHMLKSRNSYATVPFGRCTSYPCLKVQFVKENGETSIRDYTEEVVTVDPFLPLDAIEGYLWPRVSLGETKNLARVTEDLKEKDSMCPDSPSDSSTSKGKRDNIVSSEMLQTQKLQEEMCSPAETSTFEQKNIVAADVTYRHADPSRQEEHSPLQDDGRKSTNGEAAKPKLQFFLKGQLLNSELTLYQSILGQETVVEHDTITSVSLWTHIHKITYRRYMASQSSHAMCHHDEAPDSLLSKRALFCQPTPFFSRVFVSEVELEKLGSSYDVLFLLKSLEEINRLRFHLIARERINLYAKRRTHELDNFIIPINEVCHKEFVNSKLTEKLEQQMRYPMTVSVGGMPAWCTQLMAWCPFLFSFEARYKYFHLAAFGRLPSQTQTLSYSTAEDPNVSHPSYGSIPRKKFLVHRDEILKSAAKMMELHSRQKVLLEVEYNEEVGSGLGPTLEFYTLVCQEFRRSGLGMWRDDHVLEAENSGILVSPFGLFPRPWSPSATTSSSSFMYCEVIKKFDLLGKIVAKALQDGRILDLPFSKTFYKLVLGKELTVIDVQSIDPAFGRTLLEFQAIVERNRYLRSHCDEILGDHDVSFRSTKIEDLCLDFTVPGYPDYVLGSTCNSKLVNLCNLEEYVKFMVDSTVKSGISRQVEAFKSGFNQVFPIRHLKVFTEEELERLLCGEHVPWKSDELMDHIKFDHGYTASSPPILNLLEIMQEFDCEQQRAFLQFVTGAPRLPTGGLASLNPKLTIVRKQHCSTQVDANLPSVMTCANYLKLPPYSSKEVMKEKLLYAITEGQGSFHLS